MVIVTCVNTLVVKGSLPVNNPTTKGKDGKMRDYIVRCVCTRSRQKWSELDKKILLKILYSNESKFKLKTERFNVKGYQTWKILLSDHKRNIKNFHGSGVHYNLFTLKKIKKHKVRHFTRLKILHQKDLRQVRKTFSESLQSETFTFTYGLYYLCRHIKC